MTNRTILFLGNAYGETSVSLTASVNGEQVFSGVVNTINEEPPFLDDILSPIERKELSDTFTVLFSFNVPIETTGTIIVEVTPTESELIIGKFKANYTPKFRDELTDEQLLILTNLDVTEEERLAIAETLATSPLTSEELAIIQDPNSTKQEKRAIYALHDMNLMVTSGENNYQDLIPMFAKFNAVYINDFEVVHNSPFIAVRGGETLKFDWDLLYPGAE